MEITSEISSLITNKKEEFEKKFKETLVTDTLRNVISNSVPTNEVEAKRLNDPEFRKKFNSILSPITQEVIDKFENVGQFDTGNMFSSMVNSIGDSVSLESAYRMDCIYNDIKLDRVAENSIESAICDRFNKMKFSSIDIGKRAVENLKIILSTEDAAEVLDEIKDEVKGAIEETEDKNELVEGTTKEIIDYKKEMAPPEDQYDNPEENDNGDEESDEGDNNGEAEEDTSENSTDTDDNEESQDGESDSETDGNKDDSGENDDINSDEEADQSNPSVEESDEGNEDFTEGTDEEDAGTTDNDSSDDASLEDNTGDIDGGDDASLGDDASDIDGDDETTDVDINAEIDDESSETPSDNSQTENASNNTPSQNSGIVINITGADLAKGKESLNFITAERFASKNVPTHPRTFDEMKLPNVYNMASEACNATGNIKEELNIKFDSLRYGIHQVKDAKSVEALESKLNKLKSISEEALHLSDSMKNSLYEVGLCPDGLVNSKENTFFCAANVIKRFLAKTKKVTPRILPYTSTENVLTNAFDILQMRQELKNMKGDVDNARAEDLYSRESMFYKNIAAIEDPELVKQASAVLDLTDVKLDKALTTNFITDYKIKAWEVNVGKNANKNINEVITKRVEKKFKELWGRDLNKEEHDIINAVTNNQDVTEIVPNPFEKFLIKMSKDTMFGGKSTEAVKYSLSKKEKANIIFKAKLYTTLYTAAEKFNIIDNADRFTVNDFCEHFDVL